MDRMLSAKATYICYEIESKINCNYCNATEVTINNNISFVVEIPIIREKISKVYTCKNFKDMTTDDIVKDFIEVVEKYILSTYIYKQAEKE